MDSNGCRVWGTANLCGTGVCEDTLTCATCSKIFASPVTFGPIGGVASVAERIDSQDLHWDLAGYDPTTRIFKVRLGNGDGTFRAPLNRTLPEGSTDLSLNLVDDDDVLDLVYRSSAGSLLWVRGVGDGSFASDAHELISASLASVGAYSLWDLDKDGDLDVVYLSNPSDLFHWVDVNVLRNDGSGIMTETVNQSIDAEYKTVEFRIFDNNGDGQFDLLLSARQGSPTKGALFLATNVGNAYFGQFNQIYKGPPTGDAPILAHSPFDFDGDGDLDLLFLENGYVSVMEGRGNGQFQRAYNIGILSDTIGRPLFADFNRDGQIDVAVPLTQDGVLAFLRGNSGLFWSATSYQRFNAGPSPVEAFDRDFDEDGFIDVVVFDRSNHAATVYLQRCF